ncbi:MAG: DUF2480 family protein [Sporocytophaga sp.]|uniref:DUF2480 family protein n=1 Tax=Sporocytophaga sp. TaxID=2231183 RepID=UPI001B1BD2EC|nr:DUF2480 family protein [Sporocytophaga sp.]MBO9703451.1 DUF2480 family protein [Sporocytophaga sp.]
MENNGNEIVNRVANSDLVLLNLEDYYNKGERVVYDIKDNLFQGLILREKEFRAFVKENDWSFYNGKNVAIICSEDAIVPSWAYMLLISKIEPYANQVVIGDLGSLEQALFQEALRSIDPAAYKDAKVIIKGCSKFPVPLFAYGELTRMLRPFVQSLMYGEPCSTVPIYKVAKK